MATGAKRGRKAPPPVRRKARAPALGGGERFELAMRAINEGVYDWDVANGTIYYSEAVYSVLHMPRSVKTPAGWRKRIHPEDLAAYDAAIVAHFKKKTRRFESDYRYQARDRTWRWARQHGIMQRDARGRVIRMIGSTGDITKFKRVEMALAESRERYALATWAATEGIYEWNLATGALFLSDRHKAFFGVKGVKSAKPTPAAWNARVHPDDYPGYRAALAAYFKGRTRQFEHEYRIRNTKGGGYAWVVDRAAAVRDAGGRVIRLVGALADVTQRKLAEIELRRARDEATVALEQQTATAEILAAMSGSMTDTKPVFDAIVRSCNALFKGSGVALRLVRDGALHIEANVGYDAGAVPVDRSSAVGACVLDGRAIHFPDIEAAAQEFPRVRKLGLKYGYRSGVYAPLLRKGTAIGTISVLRPAIGAFSDKELELLQTFADQAVIAIENVRLFNETREALERQTATSEVLRVISQSQTDARPVFDAIIRSAVRLCAGTYGSMVRVDDDTMHLWAHYNYTPEALELVSSRYPAPVSETSLVGLSVRTGKIVHSPDRLNDARSRETPYTRALEIRAQLTVPLLKDGRAIGTLNVLRKEAGAFTEEQIGLLRTFADQAVIAIENVRLFNETKESLERQTATAEILKVIASSPSDVQPVFDAIAASARRLLDGGAALVARRAGDQLELAAYTSAGLLADAEMRKLFPAKITGQGHLGKAILSAAPVRISDIQTDENYSEAFRAMARVRGLRSVVSVPMLRDGEPIGVISVNRPVAGDFSDHQTNLLRTFADQAVIAIENVRLFNETKEALERQTATTEILKVIASSPSDVQPVLDAIVQSAIRLVPPWNAAINMRDGEVLRLPAAASPRVAEVNLSRFAEFFPIPFKPEVIEVVRAITECRVVEVPDCQAAEVSELTQRIAKAGRYRAGVSVPLIHKGVGIGAIVLSHPQPNARLTEKQMQLISTFADQAVIAIENVRLFNETREALERQTATGEVLAAMSGSMTDTQPVFEKIVQSLRRLFGTRFTVLQLLRDGVVEMPAVDGVGIERLRERYPRPLDETTVGGRAILTKQAVQYAPVLDNPETPLATIQFAKDFGFNSVIFTPMIHEGRVVGAIGAAHTDAKPFDERQIGLIKTFAAQAVIAIENVRLFNETKEALERQTATAEILKVISSSPTDTQPVFDAIVESCTRLLACNHATLRLVKGDRAEFAASNSTQGGKTVVESPMSIQDDAWPTSQAVLRREAVQIPDTSAEGVSVRMKQRGEQRGFRSLMVAPLLRDNDVIGTINVHRASPGRFAEKEVALLETFASQAVIAIENVRLFNETREALERQTATAGILRVISGSPTSVQPVFDSILQHATRLCEAQLGFVFTSDGKAYDPVAQHGLEAESYAAWRAAFAEHRIPGALSGLGRLLQGESSVHIPDVANEEAYRARDSLRVLTVELLGARTFLAVPLTKESAVIGAVVMYRREVRPFADKQIALLQTFADQAVIAIENVRLFNETKEALERQTATAEILKVISGSPTDVDPVFDAIIESAMRLCEANLGTVGLYDGTRYQHVAQRGGSPEYAKWLFGGPFASDPAHTIGQMIAGKSPVHVPDYRELPEYRDRNPRAVATAELGGARTFLAAPMLKDGRVVGGITIRRTEVRPFTQRQIDLVTTFASQAVIAIENVRLFNETKDSLERQTATSEILKVISSSPTDTQPVFDAIVLSAFRLFNCSTGIIMRDGDKIDLHAVAGPLATQIPLQELQKLYPMPFDPEGNISSRVMEQCRSAEILDTESPELPPQLAGILSTVARRGGFRSVTLVPLQREGIGIGVITLTHPDPGWRVNEKQRALVQTFADQAVIAIENVRLFKELQSRTDALTKSVGQLTALGEVGQALSSTLELDKVLQTIVSRAVQLTALDAGAIYEYDQGSEQFSLQAAENMDPGLVEAVRRTPIRKGDGATGRTAVTLEAVQVPDVEDDSYKGSRKDGLTRAGYRAVLAVPLLREDLLLGVLQVFRRTPGEFPSEVVELLKTFATQSAMAIQNARLFREIAEKGKQLEVASQHKSNFLASMSHELRTPLNAILGFNEMILGQVYGEVPKDMQEPLADIQTSGKHLLRLINNVLDLAKIEAGRMELSLQDYSVHDTVASVHATLRPLAAEKGLEFLASVPNDVPLAYGDGGRMAQCLMNLAGNSLKFTKAGKVEIAATANDGLLVYKVTDTGIGIPPDKIGNLFTEFKQTDATIASEYGGTGLGLSISRKFVEMHGGRIWVESELGKGSAFIIEVPLRVKTT